MARSTYVPAVAGGRPAMLPLEAELTDTWLVPNGIVGWIPDGSTITVADGRITWPRWRHLSPESGPWERDVMIASDLWAPGETGDKADLDTAIVDECVVPLLVPVTDRVRELFRELFGVTGGLRLVEQ